MIYVEYILHTQDGGARTRDVQDSPHVPRVGDVVAFDALADYQVVDVRWTFNKTAGDHVTVSACELDWGTHVADAVERWKRKNSAR